MARRCACRRSSLTSEAGESPHATGAVSVRFFVVDESQSLEQSEKAGKELWKHKSEDLRKTAFFFLFRVRIESVIVAQKNGCDGIGNTIAAVFFVGCRFLPLSAPKPLSATVQAAERGFFICRSRFPRSPPPARYSPDGQGYPTSSGDHGHPRPQ